MEALASQSAGSAAARLAALMTRLGGLPFLAELLAPVRRDVEVGLVFLGFIAALTRHDLEPFRAVTRRGGGPRCNRPAPAGRFACKQGQSLKRLGDIVTSQHRPRRAVGAEVVRVLDVQQIGQPCACAIDAALDGADRAAADRRGILVGKA